ncbi:MAG TPA: hypothetical protein VM778_05230 [Gemmatimonadota bacterium]|nr:hypothetical protein [Gemmatimonadota bacterium]
MARRLLACCIAPLALSLLHTEPSAAQQPRRIELPPPDATAEVEFTSVQSVRELSDGSLLVADRRERRLVHVDWRGEEVVVGREGPGPGEYRGIGWLHPLAGDTTLFTDSFDGRWHLVVGTRIVETLGQSRSTVAALGPRLSGTDRRGNVLAVQRAGRSGAAGAGDSLPLLKGRLGSLGVDTVTRLHAPRAGLHRLPATGGRPPTVISGNSFRPVDLALLFPDGWLAVARTRPYRVEWQRPDGGWVRGAPLPFRPLPVDDRAKRAGMARWGLPKDIEPASLPGWPETLPPFVGGGGSGGAMNALPVLLAAPDGSLLIARTPTPASAGNQYDVVARDGRLVGRITLPGNEALAGSGANALYVVAVDPLGLQTLRRHQWPDEP